MTKILLFAFCFCSMVLGQTDSIPYELVNAERTFSATCESEGIRNSFVKYFSDDCIIFNPYPINGKELYSARKNSPSFLTWYPTVAVLSSSGNFGYTTGPSEWRPRKESDTSYYGHFVSVWKKQLNGNWQVILDCGSGYSKDLKQKEIERFISLQQNKSVTSKTRSMKNCETDFSTLAASKGILHAIGKYADGNIRFHRADKFPVVGKITAREVFASSHQISFYPSRFEVSSGDDLGYVYGIALENQKDSSSYIRIWQKENDWKIVLDIMNPITKK